MILQWIRNRLTGRGANDDVAQHAEAAALNVEIESTALREEALRSDPLRDLLDDFRPRRRRNGRSPI